MTLQTGTTAQRRNRILFLTVLCVIFCGWFAYDGWYKYPRENEAKRANKTLPYSQSSILLQKSIAVGLGAVSLAALAFLVHVMRQRFVLDDSGLTMGRRHVPWDQMQALRTDQYPKRGWVDLVLSDTRKVRLDSYKIDQFDQIVEQICARKGFASPFPPAQDS
jgi:hypothetical protein